MPARTTPPATPPADRPGPDAERDGFAARRAREAEALRENLRRRKEQTRARAVAPPASRQD